MDKKYKGVIWTTHALERMRERGIKQGDAWATFRRPDKSRYSKRKGAWVYYRTWPRKTSNGVKNNQKIEVVATKNEKSPAQRTSGPGEEWVILSVWSKPVREKVRKKGKTPSFWREFLKGIIK